MIDDLNFLLTLSSTLGCGLMAGFFFAFSACIMKALAHLPPAQGIAAMQSINVAVLNPLLFVAFFGTAASCVLLTVSSLLMWHARDAIFRLIGSALYLVGTMTAIAFNVPRNDTLAAIPADSANGAIRWGSSSPVGQPGTMCERPRPLRPRHPSPSLCVIE